MYNLTCMIKLSDSDKLSFYSSKLVNSQHEMLKTLETWKEDMEILGWEHKTFMEMVELVTH